MVKGEVCKTSIHRFESGRRLQFPVRVLAVLALIALLSLGVPPAVDADHCGAAATISPAAGPPGTTFVFETNLGARSDLQLYRNNVLVRVVALDGDGFVRFEIATTSADAGRWRARAEVRQSPDCFAEASFVVGSTPDTSATEEPSPWPATILILLASALAGWSVALRRLPARRRL